ncbi:HK97 family phage prohead protease [Iamia majanohamensis]|uniref:HK97 family phage prohead protease n=1 Tax=Iamia majanohamensis TaxID=467976 RepID=A0AAF0BS81_9ACTN|nr:HK97 family phage prohead protease [Iamia majanohamensis]WCO67881.1 HK97 family phage prohead protease [Iamia majanohamensis]
MTATYEQRHLVEPVEFRSGDHGRITASGIAMRYGAKSKPIGGQFREEFRSGAFTKTLQEQDILAHNEHGGPYLGRTGAGTVRTFDSRSELAYEIDLPDTAAGRDTAHLLERGDIKGSSIGFRALPKAEQWSVDDDGMALRSVSEARLFVIDLTVQPYYDDSTASLALRSLAAEHEMDLRSVVEVAERGELAALISNPGDDDQEGEEEGRETPTLLRPHLSWLSA